MARRTLFGEVTSEGQARTHEVAEMGLGGGISGVTGGALGAVPSMLLWGATDLFGRIIPGIISHESPRAGQTYAQMPFPESFYAANPTIATLEENRARYGEQYGTIALGWEPDAPVYDMWTGELISGDLDAWHARDRTPDPPPVVTPPPVPPPFEPSPPPARRGGHDVSWINTGLSGLTSFIGGLGSALTPLMSMASETAPLWGLAAPKAAGAFGVGIPGGTPGIAPSAPATVPDGWVEEGGDVVASVPTTYLPGVTPAAGGIPGIDLFVPEAQRIEPTQYGSRARMPSSATIPYEVNGRTKYAYYRNQGRPVLYAGDFAACRRVKRAGAKARRYAGGR